MWDYPRPPAIERTNRRLRVVFGGVTIADTTSGWRILETSQPPAYYLPPTDIRLEHLEASPHRSFCEWKGEAHYLTVRAGGRDASDAAWTYPHPSAAYAAIAGHVAFYPQLMDACFVDDEQVEPNEGSFYGGWITSAVVGPFKGGPGTLGW